MFSAPFSCTIIANVKMDDTVVFNFSWCPQKSENNAHAFIIIIIIIIIITFLGGDKNKVCYGQYERGDCNLVITQKILMLV